MSMNIANEPRSKHVGRVGWGGEGDGAKKMKYLRVTMPDGSKWDVPLSVVVEDVVSHYANRNGDPRGNIETIYDDMDNSDFIDWARNNMNWSDVEGHAAKSSDAELPDFQEGWCNGDHEIIHDKDDDE